MHVERIEVATEVARDIGEPRSIEQRERLVILPPELAEPLNRQRLGGDDEAAFDLAGMHEPIEDEGGLDRLSKSHFIGEQPAHGLFCGCALGNVELMRKQPDASSKERAQPICLTEREEMQDVEARQKIVQLVQTARDQALDERMLEIRLRIRIDGNQCVGVRGESKLRAGTRELDHERTALEGRDSSDSQFRVETMGEVVALAARNAMAETSSIYLARSSPLTRSNTRSGSGSPLALASSAAFSYARSAVSAFRIALLPSWQPYS